MRDNDSMAYPLSPAETDASSDTSSNADPWSPAPSTPSSTTSSSPGDDLLGLPPSPESSPAPSPGPAYYHRDAAPPPPPPPPPSDHFDDYEDRRRGRHRHLDDAERESFLAAVRRGDCHELGLLLRGAGRDVNVNLVDGHGQTPLHQSCIDGNLDVVKLLVRHGADVRLANRDGWSPLHLASYCGNYDIVTFLVGSMNGSSP